MTDTVCVASALMGAGKTRGFIEKINPEDNIILAVPTIKLGDDIVLAMKNEGIDYEVFNSEDNFFESTKSRIEKRLIEEKDGGVLLLRINLFLCSILITWSDGMLFAMRFLT